MERNFKAIELNGKWYVQYESHSMYTWYTSIFNDWNGCSLEFYSSWIEARIAINKIL
jgi:hypothetical protein